MVAGVPAPISGWLTVRAIRVATAGDDDPASNSVQMVVAPVTVRGSPDRRRPSGEAARYIEGLAFIQDVVADPRQPVCQRLGGNDFVGPGFLALIEAFCLGTLDVADPRELTLLQHPRCREGRLDDLQFIRCGTHSLPSERYQHRNQETR